MTWLSHRTFGQRLAGGLATLGLIAMGAGGLGCSQLPATAEQIIGPSLAAAISSGSLMAATLGIELAVLSDQTPEPGSCPIVTEDGNELFLEYGAGCIPTSGLTSELISGYAQLTVAAGSGSFVGQLDGLGFENHQASGSVSGSVSIAGDLRAIDVRFEGLVWGDSDENQFDVLFEVSGDGTSYRIDSDNGIFATPEPPEALVSLAGVTASQGGLGACSLPRGGSLTIERGYASAELTYTADSPADGRVDISYNEGQVGTIEPCS